MVVQLFVKSTAETALVFWKGAAMMDESVSKGQPSRMSSKELTRPVQTTEWGCHGGRLSAVTRTRLDPLGPIHDDTNDTAHT